MSFFSLKKKRWTVEGEKSLISSYVCTNTSFHMFSTKNSMDCTLTKQARLLPACNSTTVFNITWSRMHSHLIFSSVAALRDGTNPNLDCFSWFSHDHCIDAPSLLQKMSIMFESHVNFVIGQWSIINEFKVDHECILHAEDCWVTAIGNASTLLAPRMSSMPINPSLFSSLFVRITLDKKNCLFQFEGVLGKFQRL